MHIKKITFCIALFVIFGLLNNCLAKDYRDKIAPDNEPLKGFADIGKCKLYYEIKGEGIPLIMIHGGALNCSMWDEQFNALAEKFKVIRYDTRMHGQSVSEPDTFSHHNDLFLLMQNLKIDKAIIMGLSMGGYVAIDFALEHPEKVIAIIPVSPGLTGYKFVDKASLESWEKMKKVQSYEEAAEIMQRVWTDGPKRNPEQVDSIVRNKVKQMLLSNITKIKRNIIEKREYTNAINRLSEITVPVFNIIGDLDVEGIIEISDMIMKNIKGAERYIIKGSAHYVNMEKPDEFNQIVINYLKKLKK